jgi:hypothetical protein
MAYDPKEAGLNERDQSFLEALQAKFLRNLLGKIGPNTVRGHIIGKLLAEAEKRGISWHAMLARQLPTTVEVAEATHGLTRRDRLAIESSRETAAQYVTDMAERTKAAMNERITAAVANRTPPGELARELFHATGTANMDWRRIALTETAMAVANGYLASVPEFTVLVGDSSVDACPWCREHIQGRAFRSLEEPPEEITEALSRNCVWAGKTNVGRSRHPITREGKARTTAELWHPCIPVHPHCRCRWRRLIESIETIQPGTNIVVPK